MDKPESALDSWQDEGSMNHEEIESRYSDGEEGNE